ncbi:hypothetical protein [Ligilactobacillus aviarius]|uniref:hypothetical protein n=1 Tax=Ligilactobacillus aviarius TaxID=1606 RepID=UPI0024B98FDF|nr:hypothetical protein [Ligilactobacillus aviarius]
MNFILAFVWCLIVTLVIQWILKKKLTFETIVIDTLLSFVVVYVLIRLLELGH